MPDLRDVWDAVVTPQTPPGDEVLLGALGAAGLAVLAPGLWSRGRHGLTIAHEGAHGLAAVLVGRRLEGIRLHSDASGLTLSRGRPGGPGMVLTLAVGYLGPSLLGVAAAFALSRGYAVGLLWGLVVVLALLLLQIRNLYGLWVVLLAGGVVFAVSWWGTDLWQWAFAYAVTWFLLLGAPRAVLELQAERRRRRGGTSDADQLARLTGVPGVVWVGLFLLGTLAGVALAAWWLLPGVPR